jgi:hypothetical protein
MWVLQNVYIDATSYYCTLLVRMGGGGLRAVRSQTIGKVDGQRAINRHDRYDIWKVVPVTTVTTTQFADVHAVYLCDGNPLAAFGEYRHR